MAKKNVKTTNPGAYRAYNAALEIISLPAMAELRASLSARSCVELREVMAEIILRQTQLGEIMDKVTQRPISTPKPGDFDHSFWERGRWSDTR